MKVIIKKNDLEFEFSQDRDPSQKDNYILYHDLTAKRALIFIDECVKKFKKLDSDIMEIEEDKNG